MIQSGIIQNIVSASNLESLSKNEILIDDVCEQFRFGEDHYGNMLIAPTEAVNNANTHRNKLDPEKKVSLVMEASENEVCFIIKDEGVAFVFNNVPDPTHPKNLEKLRGRGLFLIRALADEVGFEEYRTTINLNFYISIN